MKKIGKIAQYIVLVLLFSMVFLLDEDGSGVKLPLSINFLPAIGFVFVTIITFTEVLFDEKRPIPSLVTEILALALFGIVMQSYEIGLANFVLWFGALIILSINLIKALFNYRKKKNLDSVKTESGVKTYVVGIYDETHKNVNSTFIWIFVALVASITSLAVGFEKYIFLIAILPVIVIWLVLLTKYTQKTPFIKALTAVNTTCDVESYIEYLKVAMENEKLHPETLNYMNMLAANYYIAVDEDSWRLYAEKTELPTAKNYLLAYYTVSFCIALRNNDIDKANEYNQLMKQNYPKVKTNFDSLIKVYFTDDKIDNVEAIFGEDKLPFTTLSNHMTLIHYYKTRGLNEEAMKAAEWVLSKNYNTPNYNRIANEILEKE